MGMISAIIKAAIGVFLGTAVSGLIAKYAALGSLTLGSISLAYSDVIAIVVFAGIAFALRTRKESLSQIMAIAAGSQIAYTLYKIAKEAGVPL